MQVPANMMPNGSPMLGTNNEQWPKMVKDQLV
jgi:hypothetical protein